MKKALRISKIMLVFMLFTAWNVSAQDYHIQEGFSSGSLPDGWSAENISMGDWSKIPNLVFTDQTYGIKLKVKSPDVESWVQLPPVLGATNFSFSVFFRDEGGNLNAKIQSSTDGETWTDLFSPIPGLDMTNTVDFQSVDVDINVTDVIYLRVFAFTTDGAGNDNSGVYVDDFQVGKPAAATDDASLLGLYVDSTLIDGFDFDTRSYTMDVSHYMKYSVQAEANSSNATVDITQVSDINGTEAERTATVVVTSEDGTVTETTTIVFTQTDYWFKEGFDDSNDLDGWERHGTFQTSNIKVDILNQYDGEEAIKFTRGHETGNNEGDRGYLLSPKLPNLDTLTFWVAAETVLPEHQLDVYLKTSDADSTLVKSIVGTDLTFEWQEVVVPIESEDSLQIRIVGTCDINDAGDSRIWMDDFLLTYYEPPVIGADDATLSALYVGGTMVADFSSDVTSYFMDVTPIMDITVTADPTDENATVDITQATNIDGTEEERTATIVVTSADESTTSTTTIVFTNLVSAGKGFKAPEVAIYPNPATDLLNIQVPVNAYQKLEIFNIAGQKVRNTMLTSANQTINIEGLSEGIYIMSFTGEAGTHLAKFIKE